MKIAFVGMGNMAQAIAAGFISSGKVSSADIYAYAPSWDKLKANSERIGFTPCKTTAEAVDAAELIIMACKPYQLEGVINLVKDNLKGKAIISVAAGWTYQSFYNYLGDDVRIQCIMPNTPAMVGEGVMLFEDKNTLTAEELTVVKELFAALGIIETLPTELMGIGGAISGCGPAFMDLIMEAYGDAAVKYGIGRDMAYRLVAQTMLGSAKLQQVTGNHPGVLKDAVCSPRGTTIRGVSALEEGGLRSTCIKSIDEIMNFKRN